MKNLLKISVIGCSLILLVGCGNKKTLKCSLTDNSDIVKGKNIIEAVFKEDEIVKITLGVESTFDKDYVSYMDSMVDAFDDEYADYDFDDDYDDSYDWDEDYAMDFN